MKTKKCVSLDEDLIKMVDDRSINLSQLLNTLLKKHFGNRLDNKEISNIIKIFVENEDMPIGIRNEIYKAFPDLGASQVQMYDLEQRRLHKFELEDIINFYTSSFFTGKSKQEMIELHLDYFKRNPDIGFLEDHETEIHFYSSDIRVHYKLIKALQDKGLNVSSESSNRITNGLITPYRLVVQKVD